MLHEHSKLKGQLKTYAQVLKLSFALQQVNI